jgi:hypothetical protein
MFSGMIVLIAATTQERYSYGLRRRKIVENTLLTISNEEQCSLINENRVLEHSSFIQGSLYYGKKGAYDVSEITLKDGTTAVQLIPKTLLPDLFMHCFKPVAPLTVDNLRNDSNKRFKDLFVNEENLKGNGRLEFGKWKYRVTSTDNKIHMEVKVSDCKIYSIEAGFTYHRANPNRFPEPIFSYYPFKLEYDCFMYLRNSSVDKLAEDIIFIRLFNNFMLDNSI